MVNRSRWALPSAAAVIVALAAPVAQAVPLVTYTFPTDTAAGTGASYAPTTTATGLTASDINDTGANAALGMTVETLAYANPVLRINTPASTTTAALAVTNNSYYQFTMTPAGAPDLDLSSLTFEAARGGAGTPRGFAVRSSADNFAADLAAADVGTVRPTLSPVTVPLSGAAFQNVTSPITFRVYVYAPGAGSTVEFDNVTLNGTVPEPTAGALLGGVGLLLLRRRRRRTTAR